MQLTTRTSLIAVFSLLAACPAGVTTGDPTPQDAASDAVADAAPTTVDLGAIDARPPADTASDALPDALADVRSDTRSDGVARVDAAAVDAAPMHPAYLRDGRTYDQERDYIAWEGPVNYVSLRHRDGTTLPPSEGGASCGATCTESVTRIAAGGRVWGRFSYVQTFSVQLASTSDPGAGYAVIEACGTALPRILLRGGTSTTPGFSNQPQPAFAAPSAGDCQWSVRAEGGYVDLRAVTVAFRGDAPPTVDVRVDGMNGPVSYDAPAAWLVSWTSTSASRCAASGQWAGARDVTGATRFADMAAGAYAYTVTCENGAGMATDTVMVTVRRPPG